MNLDIKTIISGLSTDRTQMIILLIMVGLFVVYAFLKNLLLIDAYAMKNK